MPSTGLPGAPRGAPGQVRRRDGICYFALLPAPPSDLTVPTDSLVADLYLALLGLLGFYGAHRLWMVRRFRWNGEAFPMDEETLPAVTVQLPLYNERTVAARLIRSVGALDYPADKLEIQVLDDSSDETSEIVEREVALLRERGVRAVRIRRPDRAGYKAGALDYGMARASGELLCIFDADFTPRPDFLKRLVPAFRDPRVGMVQARWDHENREESKLTRAQSTLLDGHFVIEHSVRAQSDLYFNFNGTAGIWRRATIVDAGGWQHDTLTEDLDLSYRAQLRGWRFVYAPTVSAPAEVPPALSSFKSQQHRWAKGSVQVARKLGWRILRAPIPLRNKLEAAAHLTGNTGYPLVLALAILLPLSVTEHAHFGGVWHLFIFSLCTLSVIVFYDKSQSALGRRFRERYFDVLSAMSLGIGMCVSQTRAVLEGLFQRTGEFVRTPKRGDAVRASTYRAVLRGIPGIELLLAAWFAFGIVRALKHGVWGSLPFLLLFLWGFAWVGGLSLKEWWSDVRRRV